MAGQMNDSKTALAFSDCLMGDTPHYSPARRQAAEADPADFHT
jgi:hypothetical protein